MNKNSILKFTTGPNSIKMKVKSPYLFSAYRMIMLSICIKFAKISHKVSAFLC